MTPLPAFLLSLLQEFVGIVVSGTVSRSMPPAVTCTAYFYFAGLALSKPAAVFLMDALGFYPLSAPTARTVQPVSG